MKLARTRVAPPLSFLVAFAVFSVFALSSFAAPESTFTEPSASSAVEYAGTLTVVLGAATVDGSPAMSGATVINGSIIATSADGEAIIDLGARGRVEIGKDLSVMITCKGEGVQVQSPETGTEMRVIRGDVNTGSGVIVAGQVEVFSGPLDVTATGGTDFEIVPQDPSQPQQTPPTTGSNRKRGPGLIGWLALLGVGAGVVTGIVVGGLGHDHAATRPSAVSP